MRSNCTSIYSASYWVDLCGKGVEIDKEIDASIRKCRHARSVIGGWVYMVDTDRIGTELLHERRIKPALVGINERIFGDQLVYSR